MLAQINPVVVRIVEPPTPETSVADVLMGAVGLVGFLLLAGLVVGLLAGAAMIGVRKLRAHLRGEDDLPPVSPSPLTR